jgi:FMN-dependent NADH-azoreductase
VKLLEIQSSPRGESSDSIKLTQSFIEACKSDNTSIVVDTLNVGHDRLPGFDYEAIGAKYKAVKHEAMTEAETNVWERIQSLIQRFQNADRIVLGTPPPSRFDHQATYLDFWLQLVGVRDLRSVIVDNAWNQDRQRSEVSLAKGKAALERLVDWFLN